MEFNPYRDRLSEVERKLRSLETEARATAKEVDWHRAFDPARAGSDVRTLTDKIAQARSQLGDYSTQLSVLESAASELELRARERKRLLGFIPYAPTDAARQAQDELDQVRPKLDALRSRRSAVEQQARKLESRHADLVGNIHRYNAFDAATAARTLAGLRAAIQRQTTRRSTLLERVNEIDNLIEPKLKELKAAQKRAKSAKGVVEDLSEQIDREYARRTEAFELRDRLRDASSGSERAKIHEESERRFGNGKPGAVAHDCRERIEGLKADRRKEAAELREREQSVRTIERQIRAMVRVPPADSRSPAQRPTRARSWIRLAQMEAYIAAREGRSALDPGTRADLNIKRKEAAEFRSRLEKRSPRGGPPLEDQQWWGEWTLDATALGQLEAVGGGGQGEIYRPSRYPGLLYKEYKLQQQVDSRALDQLMRMRRAMDESDRDFIDRAAAWPAIVVHKNGAASGFLMAAAAEQFFHSFSPTNRKPTELQYLIFTPKRAWGTLALPDVRQRVEICLSTCRIVAAIHAAGGVVGDISAQNILWSLSPLQAYLIDCDGIRAAGRGSVLPQVNTPHWVDPRDPNRATTSTDLYKLAQVIVRVLSIEPYREPTDGLGGALTLPIAATAPIVALLGRFADGGSTRPSAEEWIGALSTALHKL